MIASLNRKRLKTPNEGSKPEFHLKWIRELVTGNAVVTADDAAWPRRHVGKSPESSRRVIEGRSTLASRLSSLRLSEVTGLLILLPIARTENAVTAGGSCYPQPSPVTTTGGGYVLTFCARWPDGSFSIVGADDETDALIQLDELGDEPAALWRMDSCLLDFDLTDQGTFRLKQFGEQTGPEILERGYPVLKKTLESEAFTEHAIEGAADPQKYGSAATEILGKAVETERDRLKEFQRTAANTERGKELQRELGGSGAYVDAIVEQVTSKRLRRYEPGKKSKPN
jgi:hypothetical protein